MKNLLIIFLCLTNIFTFTLLPSLVSMKLRNAEKNIDLCESRLKENTRLRKIELQNFDYYKASDREKEKVEQYQGNLQK